MAEVITESSQLKMEAYFVDGDTRTITLKNPRGGLSAADIEDVQNYIRLNNLIVGDKMGGTFGKFEKVTKIRETKQTMDFNEV